MGRTRAVRSAASSNLGRLRPPSGDVAPGVGPRCRRLPSRPRPPRKTIPRARHSDPCTPANWPIRRVRGCPGAMVRPVISNGCWTPLTSLPTGSNPRIGRPLAGLTAAGSACARCASRRRGDGRSRRPRRPSCLRCPDHRTAPPVDRQPGPCSPGFALGAATCACHPQQPLGFSFDLAPAGIASHSFRQWSLQK